MEQYYPGLSSQEQYPELIDAFRKQVSTASGLFSNHSLQRLIMFQDIIAYRQEPAGIEYFNVVQKPLMKKLQALIQASGSVLQSPKNLATEAVDSAKLDFNQAKQEAMEKSRPGDMQMLKFDTKPADALSGLSGKAVDGLKSIVRLNQNLNSAVSDDNAMLQKLESKVYAFVQQSLGVQLQGGKFFTEGTAAEMAAKQLDVKEVVRCQQVLRGS